jgi:hypothetical protein
VIKQFRRVAMKATISQIVDLAEHEVGSHLDEIIDILSEMTDKELIIYQRRLAQLSKAVNEVLKGR